jgi:hypothetical protein
MSLCLARTRALCMAVAALLAVASPVFAQAGLQGEIQGKIIDSGGLSVPGVTITASAPTMMGTRTAVSEFDGSYRIPALPSGDAYRVEYQLPGFRTVIRTGIDVNIRTTTTLDITLEVATIEESVTVSGEAPLIDSANARQGVSMSGELLQAIPTGRDFYTLMVMTPGTAKNTPSVGGAAADLSTQVVVGGSSDRRMNINGAESFVSTGDGRYGNFDAYEEVVMETGGADAATRRPGGGFQGEMVARTGGNVVHGMMSGFWYNKHMVGSNLDDRLRANGIETTNDVHSLHDFVGQAGGPFLKDKLWWFASLREYSVYRYVIGADRLQQGLLRPFVGNVTYQLTGSNRLQAFYSKDLKLNPQRSMDRFTTFEASYNQQSWAELKQLKWLSTIGQKTIVEAQAFAFKWWWPSLPQEGSGAPMRDLNTGMRWNGPASTHTERNYRRNEISVSASRFINRWIGGSHDLKTGVDVYSAPYDEIQSIGNGPDRQVSYQFRDGVPAFAVLNNGPIFIRRTVGAFAAFAQDRIAINRLTLNFGVRFDYYNGWLPEQGYAGGYRWESLFPGTIYPKVDNVVTWKDIEPRVSAVYKLTSDGKTVAKVSYGHFPNEMYAAADTDLVNPNANRSNRYVWLGDLNRNNSLDLNELGNLVSRVVPRNNSIAPGLQNPTVKELGFGFERELPGGVGLKSQYYYSRHVDQYIETNTAIPRSAYTPVPYLDPGPDGRAGTTDDRNITVYNLDQAFVGQTAFVRATLPGLSKAAHSANVSITKRLASGWQLMSSYGFTRVWEDRPVDPNDPNAEINKDGRSLLDVPHSFKLVGSYKWANIMDFSASWNVNSGFPTDRVLNVNGMRQGQFTILADPTGTHRYDAQNLLDVRFEKQIRIGGTRMALMLEGFNMLNSNASTTLDGAGVGTVTGGNFGLISKVTPPRTWRVGTRYTF